MKKSLMRIRYRDTALGICAEAHADIVVYDTVRGKKTLCAVRFGGYPEQTDAVAAAICGGGTVEIEAEGQVMSFVTLAKKYRRNTNYDGLYAEAALIAENDDIRADKAKGAKHTKKEAPEQGAQEDVSDSDRPVHDTAPRNVYIYVPQGDVSALFDAVDRQTCVPLIPEFADYLLSELQRAKILAPMKIIAASPATATFEAWILRCAANDANIIGIAEKGLSEGKISIPGAAPGKQTALDEVSGVVDYLTKYGRAVAEHIKSRFVPLFDPDKDEISSEVAAADKIIEKKAGYALYDAQLAVAEAVKRRLSYAKAGFVIAECGSGKTKMGSVALYAFQSAKKRGTGRKRKYFNVVLCPSHVAKKWVREIEESTESTFAAVVENPAQFTALYETYETGEKNCYAVVSKETARDGYMRAPAAGWSRSKGAFVCPDCGETVEMRISDGGGSYRVPADQFFFKSETDANHKCMRCGSLLWTALNPDGKAGPWAKIGSYGFVFAPRAAEHLRKTANPEIREKILQAADGRTRPAGAHRKYPLSTYIKKKYRGKIDGLIADELHQYNNDSGQGDAMGELFGTTKKAIGMTATLINGYSSGLFHLFYRIASALMQNDGQRHDAQSAFAAEYGVVESTYVIEHGDYSRNRRTVKRKKGTRQLPGVSPLIYSKFLLEQAVFLSLADMGKDLPEYEEIPTALHMPEDVSDAYYRMQKTLVKFMREDRRAAKKILSAYMNLLIAYPDQPYGQKPIRHPAGDYPIVTPPDIGNVERLLPKDETAFEITLRKVQAGGNVLIYTNWTRLDTAEKLTSALTSAGVNTCVLPAKVKPSLREEWIANRLAEGLRVLITNPTIVETGLDLNAFTTLIFYDTGTKLFTMRQASRRSWRINQNAPRIEVYMLYYANTMQHKLLKLMGTKLAAAAIIEGGFSDEGLAAMSQCDDMTAMMAKELMLGIKDSVEDVSASFKRMAVLKPKNADISADIADDFSETAADAEMPEFTFEPCTNPPTELPVPMYRKRKLPIPDENQIDFFEHIA